MILKNFISFLFLIYCSPGRPFFVSHQYAERRTCSFNANPYSSGTYAVLRLSSQRNDGPSNEDDDAFGAWVSSNLMQWPLAPPPVGDNETPSKEANVVSPGKSNPPNEATITKSLSRLLNIEMLLNLTQQTRDSATVADNLLPVQKTSIISERAEREADPGSFTFWDTKNKSLVEGWVKQASTSIEYLINEVSSIEIVEDLRSKNATDLIETAKQIALDRGLTNVTERARETASFAKSFFQIADRLVNSKRSAEAVPLLLDAFNTVRPQDCPKALQLASCMGSLSAAVYEETLPRVRQLGHALVARNTTEDVTWMITDAVDDDDGTFIRYLTIRGYDASDESVDRERLLRRICTANPQNLRGGMMVHAGLYEIAEAIFRDAVEPYLYDWKAPTQKIVITGHSVGGSLSILLLLLMIDEYGETWCRQHLERVYTFGSPPIAANADDLPHDLVWGYVQPWDPIVRLFSPIDALYPLVSDTGEDGITPFADGPPRTLRPLLKPILEAWDGWPRFRETFRGTGNQTSYDPVGLQHILLPEPTRYLADRFVAIDVLVPSIESVLQLDRSELYAILETIFPLDVFEISFVPQAIRSFIHHFYPAYWNPIVDHSNRLQQLSKTNETYISGRRDRMSDLSDLVVPIERNGIAIETNSRSRRTSMWFSNTADTTTRSTRTTKSSPKP